MNPKKEWPRLGPMELARGLVVCAGSGCAGCPFDRPGDELVCIDELKLQAAEMIQGLYDAGEKTAGKLAQQLVTMAKEANTALERRLEGVNAAKLADMTAVQNELEAFGRASAIRAEPVGHGEGMRIAEVNVAGVTVFSAEAADG